MSQKKQSNFKLLEAQFKEKQLNERKKIKQEPNKLKRALKWIAHLFVFPWKWIWVNVRDWRTAIIFVLVFIVLSCEVWVPYLIYFITHNTWWLGIGSACWLFWAMPCTPFLVICIGLTMVIKGIINKIESK